MFFRDINPILINKLGEVKNTILKTNQMQATEWHLFYEFILMSYTYEQSERFSVSDVATFLKGIDNVGYISTVYAHCLYVLALKDNRKIYKGGVNP